MVVCAGAIFVAHAGCDPIDVSSAREPSVPVYGLPVDGVEDPDVIKDQYIVILPQGTTELERRDVERRISSLSDHVAMVRSYDFKQFQGFVVNIPPDILEQVRYFNDIAWIEANQRGKRTGLQTCPPWNLDAIDSHAPVGGTVLPDALLDEAFAYTQTGEGVHVLVVDTGLDKGIHSDFNAKPVDGALYFPRMCDSDDATTGHGTMLAEVVAGKTLGVAKQATIMGYNVPNRRCHNDPNVDVCAPKANCGAWQGGCAAECFNLATSMCDVLCDPCKEKFENEVTLDDDLAALGDVADKIATLPRPLVLVFPHVYKKVPSLAGKLNALEMAVNAIVADGAIFVASAGNDAVDACTLSPSVLSATNERVISVGGLSLKDGAVKLLSAGPCVDVYAPGVNVRTKSPTTTCTASGEKNEKGSSFAAAHVAGIVALMLQVNPTTESFKSKRFNDLARRMLTLDGGEQVPLLHNPYNIGESEKNNMPSDADADGKEDMITPCDSQGCSICSMPDAMDPDATVNPCNTSGVCTGRLRCTETECAPCGREGSRCCSMGVKCDGNLECNSNDFCACGEEGQSCCTGLPTEQCGAGLVCNVVDNKCTACGKNAGDPCCNGSPVEKCGSGLICGMDSKCIDCGAKGDPCCFDGSIVSCDNSDLICDNGTCADACVVTCCDDTKVVLSPLADTQCIRNGGDTCWNRSGPKEIRNHSAPIWGPTQCGSLREAEVVCCDGTRIPLNPQFDENIAKEIAIEECNVGPDSKMRETYMGGQIIASIYPDSCGKCDVLCCDGTRIGGDFTWPGVSDQNACMLFGGLSCREHGYGPQRIVYDTQPLDTTPGKIIWSKEYGSCPTMHPCIATCNDGRTIFVEDDFDEGVCNLMAQSACTDYGGLLEAQLLGTSSVCTARCYQGHVIQTKDTMFSAEDCKKWAADECAGRGFGDMRRVRYNSVPVFNYDASYLGACGGNEHYCCETKDDLDNDGTLDNCVNQPDYRCVRFAPPPGAIGFAYCSDCGANNQKCCANDKCGKDLTCKPDMNGNETCQP